MSIRSSGIVVSAYRVYVLGVQLGRPWIFFGRHRSIPNPVIEPIQHCIHACHLETHAEREWPHFMRISIHGKLLVEQ